MKIAIICSHGGHLTELQYLVESYNSHDYFFITYESERTKNIHQKAYLLPNFGKEPLLVFKEFPRMLKIIIKEKPDLIISNGAEIAIPFFYLAKLFRLPTIFFESYTRVNIPSVTGKLVYPIADNFIVFWSEILKSYGKKAKYWGNLLQLRPNDQIITKEKNTILVLTGMHYVAFDELIKAIDEIAFHTQENFLIQIGNSECIPKYANYFRFKEYDEIIHLIKKSKLVICQGAMSAVDSIIFGTPTIIIPRKKNRNEVINDHQVIFGEALERMGVVKISDFNTLENLLKEKSYSLNYDISINPELIQKIQSLLYDLDE